MEEGASAVVRVFCGTVVHALALDKLSVVPRAWLGVDAAGRIAFLHSPQQDGEADRPTLIHKYTPLYLFLLFRK
jgi:hypothetical protein